ncbi:hypothetical protein BDZ89DRAFT_1076796 [Hymenopellis radicata]|nr:hypothetical protein BDZ89DRAFT_1076796 [Hymenopellis radicata]
MTGSLTLFQPSPVLECRHRKVQKLIGRLNTGPDRPFINTCSFPQSDINQSAGGAFKLDRQAN